MSKILKIQRSRASFSGYSEPKDAEELMAEILNKIDEIIDYLNATDAPKGKR